MKTTGRTLAIIAEMYACRHEGAVYIHLSFGRVIDRLAAHFERVLLCVPAREGPPPASRDYRIAAPQLALVPQPYYPTTIGALRHPLGIVGAYRRVLRAADAVFIRGMPPFSAGLYAWARWYGRRPVHWVVGDPVALLKSHQRAGRLKDALALLYAHQDRACTRAGRRLTGGAFICNGDALAGIYRSPRTEATVSSTITDDEFFERDDTCNGDAVELLFVGFPRPEKGLPHLFAALPQINCGRPVHLTIVGAADEFRGYRAELERLAAELGIASDIRWVGYLPYGPEMFRYLRSADILVLPTLSEGTPRVLVEARANSLPVVATSVGGIPTSVTHGTDGLLVPPKDAPALAAAIRRLATDADLRRRLIRAGRERMRTLTVDRFVERAVKLLETEA